MSDRLKVLRSIVWNRMNFIIQFSILSFSLPAVCARPELCGCASMNTRVEKQINCFGIAPAFQTPMDVVFMIASLSHSFHGVHNPYTHTHEPSDTCTTRSLHIQYIQTKLCYEFNEIAFVLTRQRERANNSQWRTETTAPLYIKIVSAGLRCRFTFTAYSLFTAFIPVFVQNPTQWSAGWMWSERITIFPTDFVFYLLFHLRLRGAHYDYESAIYFSLFIYIFIVLRIGLKWIKFIKWKRKSV